MQKKIRVLIAEDLEPIRTRYVHFLESDPDIEVVAAVGDGEAAVLQTRATRPDVILMDIEMGSKDAGLRPPAGSWRNFRKAASSSSPFTRRTKWYFRHFSSARAITC